MPKPSIPKFGKLWRTDGFVGVVIVLALASLAFFTDAFAPLERRVYDWASTASSRQPLADRIAIIAIDDQSVANIGRWPWSRDVHAKLIDQLAAAKAKTVVHTALFFEPQTERGLEVIRQIRIALAAGGGNEQVARLIEQAEAALDTDAQLAASLKAAGNVILPAAFEIGVPQGNSDRPLKPATLRSALDENQGFSVDAVRAQEPIDLLGEAAAGIGHLSTPTDPDGTIRQEPLLVNYFGKALPSMSLLAAAHSLNLRPADIKLRQGEGLLVGRLRISTDDAARMRPQFYAMKDGRSPFSKDSFYDVINGKIPASKYAGKIVLIGATAAGVGTFSPVPGNPALAPVEMLAHVVSSILAEHFIVEPAWGVLASRAAFLLVAIYLVVGLPRLSAGKAAGATAILALGLMGAEYGLLASASMWLQFSLAVVLLAVGHLALTTKRFLMTEAGKVKSDQESAETNRMMGLSLQGQGQLDMAFDRFSRLPMSAALMDNLYNLALDFERKRQFNKAQAVYEHMAAWDKNYKDLSTKLARAKNLSETVMLGGGTAHPGGTLLLDGGAVEKPMLGRYQVERELGKGAMGVVYQGRDPKIGRIVAIKTMALSSEFEGDELADARDRFFREAETAGRLQHPHIVTIYDAGEDHDLAYIAMEFLKGKDLMDRCKPGKLLPVPRVLSIVERVALALSYAHKQSVVHRDIKPANIMYEPESDTVKVTDFGIARITDSSRTKTGLVLGTPSFMSPEQIAGKRVDGRSDLYSLGVMLFQMLTGVLPYRGDSMAELMYKIANEEAADVRSLRPELSPRVADVIALCLSKRPELRYQDGEQLAADLRLCTALGDEAPLARTTDAAPAAERALPPPGPMASGGTAVFAADAPPFGATMPHVRTDGGGYDARPDEGIAGFDATVPFSRDKGADRGPASS